MKDPRRSPLALVAAGLLIGGLSSVFAQDETPENTAPETVIRQKAGATSEEGTPVQTASQPQAPPPPPLPMIDEPAIPNGAADADPAKSAPPAEPPANAEPEVLAHGPVHEAFAGPVADSPDDALIVDRSPPEPVDEVPPDVAPEGNNVQWIPGYWGWDPEAEDYVWISGLWRDIPPGQRWVPGHWAEVEGGYRWVSGLWTSAEVAELEYLPYPPESLEQGPNISAPGDNYFWVPGCWMYQTSNYQWRPGYWAPAYDDWCWVPRRYVWTPRGALWSAGYWDYRFVRRGLLFAPLRFRGPGWYGRGYRYRPYETLDPAGLLVSLFVRPGYRHYYFGDYFGRPYRDRGFRPWHLANGRRRYSDPLYSYYDSYYGRRGVNFGDRLDSWHRYFDDHPDRRPPRVVTRNDSRRNDSPLRLTSSLAQLTRAEHGSPVRLNRITGEGRKSVEQMSNQLRSLAQQRSTVERSARSKLDRDPLSGNRSARAAIERGPLGNRNQPDAMDRPERIARGGNKLNRADLETEVTRRLQLPPVQQKRVEQAGRRPNVAEARTLGLRERRESAPPALEGRDRRGPSHEAERFPNLSRETRPSTRREASPDPAVKRDPLPRNLLENRNAGNESRPKRIEPPQRKTPSPRSEGRILQQPPSSRAAPRATAPNSPRIERPSTRGSDNRPRATPPARSAPQLKPGNARPQLKSSAQRPQLKSGGSRPQLRSNSSGSSRPPSSFRSSGKSSRSGPSLGNRSPSSRNASRGRSSGRGGGGGGSNRRGK